MNFLLILVVVFVEMFVYTFEDLRSRGWTHDCLAWLTRVSGGHGWWSGWIGALVTVALPPLAVALAFSVLRGVSPLLADLASVFVLFLMLGPRDLNLEVDAYNRGLGAEPATTRHPEFPALAAGLSLGESTGDEAHDETGEELAGLALAADAAWYQPLFWFLVLGPVGAVLYRQSANLRTAKDVDDRLARALEQIHEALEWLPARITVLAFGLAGTLAPVLETAHRVGVLRFGDTAELLARTALAAIDHGRIHDTIVGDPRIYRMNVMHALVRRALVVWLVIIAVGALVIV